MQMSEESKSLASGADEDFDPKPPAKKAKKTAKDTSKEPKEAGGGKKKGGKSPNKTSSAKDNKDKKDKKKPAKKPAAKKKGDDEDSKMDVEDDENYNPNFEKEDSDSDSDDDFDGDSEKPSKSKGKGKAPSAKKGKENTKTSAKGKKGGGGAASKDEETDMVLDYMKKQNRPYSLINIYDNLHAKIKKPQVQRILDSLADAGELQMKEFGKAKIYLLNQKNIPDVNQADLDKISKEVQDLRTTHRELTDEIKGLTADLKDLQNQLTDEQLDAEIAKYEKMLMEAESKLKVYESGNYPKISDEDMKKAEDKQQYYEKEFKKRKKMCMDMVNQVSEMADQKVANLIDEIGIDLQFE